MNFMSSEHCEPLARLKTSEKAKFLMDEETLKLHMTTVVEEQKV